jgi:hypothetical protein
VPIFWQWIFCRDSWFFLSTAGNDFGFQALYPEIKHVGMSCLLMLNIICSLWSVLLKCQRHLPEIYAFEK